MPAVPGRNQLEKAYHAPTKGEGGMNDSIGLLAGILGGLAFIATYYMGFRHGRMAGGNSIIVDNREVYVQPPVEDEDPADYWKHGIDPSDN